MKENKEKEEKKDTKVTVIQNGKPVDIEKVELPKEAIEIIKHQLKY